MFLINGIQKKLIEILTLNVTNVISLKLSYRNPKSIFASDVLENNYCTNFNIVGDLKDLNHQKIFTLHLMYWTF